MCLPGWFYLCRFQYYLFYICHCFVVMVTFVLFLVPPSWLYLMCASPFLCLFWFYYFYAYPVLFILCFSRDYDFYVCPGFIFYASPVFYRYPGCINFTLIIIFLFLCSFQLYFLNVYSSCSIFMYAPVLFLFYVYIGFTLCMSILVSFFICTPVLFFMFIPLLLFLPQLFFSYVYPSVFFFCVYPDFILLTSILVLFFVCLSWFYSFYVVPSFIFMFFPVLLLMFISLLHIHIKKNKRADKLTIGRLT